MTQTREPVPSGAPTVTIEACKTCGPQEFMFSRSDTGNTTRSIEPGPDGRYVMQAHVDWCPVLVGEPDGVAAPCCGARIDGLTHASAFWLIVPGLDVNGNPVEHRVLDRGGTSRHDLWAIRREPAPEHDTILLDPCGHTIEGEAVRVLLDALTAENQRQMRAKGDRVLAGLADLLAAAEQAGHHALVEEYRRAVYGGLPTQSGLLAALRTVAR